MRAIARAGDPTGARSNSNALALSLVRSMAFFVSVRGWPSFSNVRERRPLRPVKDSRPARVKVAVSRPMPRKS